MQRKRYFDSVMYPNGWHTRNEMINSGITLQNIISNNTMILYTDIDNDEWICGTGTTAPVIYNSNTTGITVSAVPSYLGGTSAYTYQLNIRNQNHADVTAECTYSSRNTQVVTVSSGGLISGYYTGITLAYVGIQHPDLLTPVSSNTFTVAQIVTAITPYVTSIIGGTGLTYSALTYKDQWNNSIISNNVTRSGYNTGMISSIDQTGGTIYFGYTGSTSITATPTYATSVTPAVTTVVVTIDGNPLTTGITISTIPYIGGASAYTYQIAVTDNNGNVVTAECTYTSNDTRIATVSSLGLVTGIYTGSTYVIVRHPDMTSNVNSNTFVVNQIVRSMVPYSTSIIGATGLTYTALTYTDQSGSTISTSNIIRRGYNTGMINSIDQTGGTIYFGYTGSTSILASGTFGGIGVSASTTSVLVTVDGNPLSTGLTITTGNVASGSTYQVVVTDNNGNTVTNECSYVSQNTYFATINSTGLITGRVTGTTSIVVRHPDMINSVTSNTFSIVIKGVLTSTSAVTVGSSNPTIGFSLANTTYSFAGMGVLPQTCPSAYWSFDFGSTGLILGTVTIRTSTYATITTTGTVKAGTIAITALSTTMANTVNSNTVSITPITPGTLTLTLPINKNDTNFTRTFTVADDTFVNGATPGIASNWILDSTQCGNFTIGSISYNDITPFTINITFSGTADQGSGHLTAKANIMNKGVATNALIFPVGK